MNRTKTTTNLLAGGGAGIMEACVCHPLDTVKVRMQLLNKEGSSVMMRRGLLGTFTGILRVEGFTALYKGFDAVVTGMGPKMAVRFTSFEMYKSLLPSILGDLTGSAIFLSGLAAGVTEAVCVVTPMEVVKIRLQGQKVVAAITGGIAEPRFNNAFQTVISVVRHEGMGALYQGVFLTALRQGTNQAANFTVYTMLKDSLAKRTKTEELPSYQTAMIGLISGAAGPLCNAPIDTIKTRLQSTKFSQSGGLQRGVGIARKMLLEEGVRGFYKGLTPRMIRVAPGQAVTFTAYEFLKKQIHG